MLMMRKEEEERRLTLTSSRQEVERKAERGAGQPEGSTDEGPFPYSSPPPPLTRVTRHKEPIKV